MPILVKMVKESKLGEIFDVSPEYQLLDESVEKPQRADRRKSLYFCSKIFAVFVIFLTLVLIYEANKVDTLATPTSTTMVAPTEEPKEPMDPRYDIINNYPACQLDKDRSSPRVDVKALVEQFHACANPIVQKWKGNATAVNELWEQTEPCDAVFRGVDITYMQNKDETKWVILPNCKEDNVMVTMGIGYDTVGEEKLSRTIPNTKFYGADPILHPNKELYSKFGKYYPFAIGSKPGTETFRVMEKLYFYEDQEVVTIPFTYFLGDILKLKKIDIAWIDIEGGELQFLDTLHKGAELDKKGVTICQFNMEVHSKFFPHLAVAYHDFIFRLLEEQRYVFLKPSRTNVGVHKMFFINVENKECVRKFLQ